MMGIVILVFAVLFGIWLIFAVLGAKVAAYDSASKERHRDQLRVLLSREPTDDEARYSPTEDMVYVVEELIARLGRPPTVDELRTQKKGVLSDRIRAQQFVDAPRKKAAFSSLTEQMGREPTMLELGDALKGKTIHGRYKI